MDAMRVFSRSKAASWRSGDSTWPRSRSSPVAVRLRPPGVVRTRPCSTTDGRWISADVVVPVDDAGVEAEAGLVLGRSAQPTAPAAGRGRRPPRTRRRPRRARRSRRRPLGLLAASPRPWPPNSACLPAEGQGGEHRLGPLEGGLGPARAGVWTRPRPGNDQVGHDDGLALVVVERVLEEPVAAPGRPGGGSAAGSAMPEATWHDLGHGLRPSVGLGALGRHRDQMAPTTRSTGMTSTMPSGTPGNSLSRPRA